jgi:hypothetical protein
VFAGGGLDITASFLESAFSDGQLHIEADDITLSATNQIGTALSPLQVKVNGGTLSAESHPLTGDVYVNVPNGGATDISFVWGRNVSLSNPLGSFTINGAVEAANDLNLSAGSLFSSTGTAEQLAAYPYWGAAIGRTVELTAGTGDIGTVNLPFYLVSSSNGRTPTAGIPLVTLQVNATQGSLYLQQRLPGDLSIFQLNTQNAVALAVDDGDLLISAQLPNSKSFVTTASGTVSINGTQFYSPPSSADTPAATAPTVASVQPQPPVASTTPMAPVNTDDQDEEEEEEEQGAFGGSEGR